MALILFALAALSLATAWFLKKERTNEEKPDLGGVVVAFGLNIVFAILAHAFLKPPEQNPAVIGLAVGLLGNLLAYFGSRVRNPSIVGLSIGCVMSGFLLLTAKTNLDITCLAVCVGAGSTAALAANRSSSLAALITLAVAFAHLLGHTKGASPVIDNLAPFAIGTFTLTALGGTVLKQLREKELLWSIVCGVAGIIALAVISKFCLPDSSDWYGLLIVPLAALVIYWLGKSNPDRPQFSLALSTIMWIGLATIAFGIQRGLGIGIAFLIATGVLALLDAQRTLLSSGPLMALVLHRVFRMEHPGVGGAIDIGQHYALIGFTLACLLPLLPSEWLKLHLKLSGSLRSVSSFIWLAVCFAAPCLIALFLAPKGLLGFVTGLGFCGFFAWLGLEEDAGVLAFAGALGAAAIVEYEVVESFSNLARSEKIHWFLLTSAFLAIIAVVLTLISTSKNKKPLTVEPS